MRIFSKTGAIAILAASLIGAGAFGMAEAQTVQRVDAQKDWSVFKAGDGEQRVCWIASQPTRTAAFRSGRSVQVNRGEIFLMVSIRPADGVANEVSVIAGYPFKKGSEVTAKVGSQSYTLFTEGENAWAPSADDDKALVEAFRRGADAKVEGVSSRGTKTVDTYSLSGFTAALEQAMEMCKS